MEIETNIYAEDYRYIILYGEKQLYFYTQMSLYSGKFTDFAGIINRSGSRRNKT